MKKKVELILEHMLEDAQDIVDFANSAGSYESFCRNTMIRKAIVMSLLNIGELANHLPAEYTDTHRDIPWKRMIGMRNFAAHGYHTMNYEVIWETAQIFVPTLLSFLQTQFSGKS